MSQVIKWIGSSALVAQWVEDFAIDKQITTGKLLRWIGEFVDWVKVTPTLESKNEVITISDYRGILPCDLVWIIQVSNNGLGLRYATNSGANVFHHKDSPDLGSKSVNTYTIQWPYISPYFKQGSLHIMYQALPTDEKGFPLIIDNAKMKEALINFFIFKEKKASWVAERITYQQYLGFKKEFEELADDAVSELSMPTPDEWESIANRHTRLIPDVNAHEHLFYTGSDKDPLTFG